MTSGASAVFGFWFISPGKCLVPKCSLPGLPSWSARSSVRYFLAQLLDARFALCHDVLQHKTIV
jgi:hypothetical protein